MAIIFEESQTHLAEFLSKDLSARLLKLGISQFPNGEFKINAENLKLRHVLVLFPQIRNINSDLLKFFLMVNACKQCEIIDVFIPYIPYSRQDNSPAVNLILDILQSLSIRHIITLDIHKVPNNRPIINIMPHEIFANRFENDSLIIVAPDLGATNRAAAFAEYLQTDLVIIDKKSNNISGEEKVYNRNCLIVDDIIDSGKTLNNAIAILQKAGARSIKSRITHDFRKSRV